MGMSYAMPYPVRQGTRQGHMGCRGIARALLTTHDYVQLCIHSTGSASMTLKGNVVIMFLTVDIAFNLNF